jgi:cytochrome c oxidase assembly protein subunit 15
MMNTNHSDQASPDQGEAAVVCSTRRIAYYFVGLLFVLFLMVLAGGSVRLTGSGMSIPDWPIIYYGPDKTNGSILPPMNPGQWEVARQTYYTEYWSKHRPEEELTMARFQREFHFEYGHRAIGKTIGVLLLVGLGLVLWHPEARRRAGVLLVASFAMFTAVIILGGIAVRLHTKALAVAIHLTGAFLFIAAILWVTLRLMRPDAVKVPERTPWAMRFTWVTAGIVLLQIFIGGLVAKTGAGKHFNDWPTMGGVWVPSPESLWQESYRNPMLNLVENIVLLQFVHRWFAFVAAAFVVVLVWRALSRPLSARGRFLARFLAFTLVAQILLGIFTLLEAVPYLLGIGHLLTGLLLFQLIIGLAYEIRHHEPLLAYEDETIFHRTAQLEAKPA